MTETALFLPFVRSPLSLSRFVSLSFFLFSVHLSRFLNSFDIASSFSVFFEFNVLLVVFFRLSSPDVFLLNPPSTPPLDDGSEYIVGSRSQARESRQGRRLERNLGRFSTFSFSLFLHFPLYSFPFFSYLFIPPLFLSLFVILSPVFVSLSSSLSLSLRVFVSPSIFLLVASFAIFFNSKASLRSLCRESK